jgi:hypothetical protein
VWSSEIGSSPLFGAQQESKKLRSHADIEVESVLIGVNEQFDDWKCNRYFCFRLFTWEDRGRRRSHNSLEITPEIWFLVLQKSLSRDTYERIGIGSSESYNWNALFEDCEIKSIRII